MSRITIQVGKVDCTKDTLPHASPFEGLFFYSKPNEYCVRGIQMNNYSLREKMIRMSEYSDHWLEALVRWEINCKAKSRTPSMTQLLYVKRGRSVWTLEGELHRCRHCRLPLPTFRLAVKKKYLIGGHINFDGGMSPFPWMHSVCKYWVPRKNGP